MSTVTLQNDSCRIVLSPELGCGVLACEFRKGADWLPIMPDARAEDCTLSCSSFLMIPYSNRVADGFFRFQTREFQLNHSDKHAIHGDVRGRAWTVETQTTTSFVATFHSRDHKNVNWPWPFDARVEIRLDGASIHQSVTLTNCGTSPMPAGFGWHPYFSRSLTSDGEPVHLQFSVKGVYPDENDNRIPSGLSEPPSEEQDFSSVTELTPDGFLDICCEGYDGKGVISWPSSDVSLTFDCSRKLGHLVIYNPADAPFFAVEPVTNANDGVNLSARDDRTSGVQVLEPDESLSASFVMHLA